MKKISHPGRRVPSKTGEIYQLRRKSDGKWYGRRPRFSDRNEGCWHEKAGRYFSANGLKALLSDRWTDDVEVITYHIVEVARQPANSFIHAISEACPSLST